MRARPAKSSSFANDFKRYACCPIPLVYHALFEGRKTPIALLLCQKCVPSRPSVQSFQAAQVRRTGAQILDPLACIAHALPNFCQARSTAAGSKAEKTADDFVDFAYLDCAVAPTPTRARSLRNRTHTEPPITSPATRTFPRRRRQNHPPPCAALRRPRRVSHRSSFLAALSLEAASLDVESAHALEPRR